MALLLRNVRCLTFEPGYSREVDVRIEHGIIAEVGAGLKRKASDEAFHLSGKIIMPGLVNAHTHLYSSLARGMAGPKERPANFLEILQKVWWRLDRALDEETIYFSAMAGAIEAALCGTTTLVDHHASPTAIPGSLDIIKEVLREVGIRGVLCYEVTDRGGKKERDAGLAENERFIRENKQDPDFRGMVGAHAAFTLSNESLRLCGEMATENAAGVHIHVAEDACDIVDSEENFRESVVDRLARHGIVKRESILAHCVHLTPAMIAAVRRADCWFAHNPRSNMNNGVGYAPVQLLGERTALGTDGFPADMFEEARSGFVRMKERSAQLHSPRATRGVRKAPVEDPSMIGFLRGGQKLVGEVFGQKFGVLSKGAVADLVVMDYEPPTPLTKQNVEGHVVFGIRSAMVESVMVGGKWIVKHREIVGLDSRAVLAKASAAAAKLWRKMEKAR